MGGFSGDAKDSESRSIWLLSWVARLMDKTNRYHMCFDHSACHKNPSSILIFGGNAPGVHVCAELLTESSFEDEFTEIPECHQRKLTQDQV